MSYNPDYSKMEKVSPGFYRDPADNTMHVDCRELCLKFNLPHTRENEDIIAGMLKEISAKELPATQVHYHTPESDEQRN